MRGLRRRVLGGVDIGGEQQELRADDARRRTACASRQHAPRHHRQIQRAR